MALNITQGRRTVTIIPDDSTDFDIATMQAWALPLGTVVGAFTVGEAVSQAVSGATGVVYAWKNSTLYLTDMVGTFDTTNTVTGAASTATGIPSEVRTAFPAGIRLSAVDFIGSSDTDILVIRDKIATGPIVYSRRDVGGGGLHQAKGGRSLKCRPYIAAADCQFQTPANVRIILEYD